MSRISRWALVVTFGAALLMPVAATAALPEFVALMLYFYLMQQPQMMNNTQDVVDSNLKAADSITRSRLEIWGQEVSMAMIDVYKRQTVVGVGGATIFGASSGDVTIDGTVQVR